MLFGRFFIYAIIENCKKKTGLTLIRLLQESDGFGLIRCAAIRGKIRYSNVPPALRG
jgi:hypothetical protein